MHTVDAASSTSRLSAPSASRRTSSAVRATGVSAVAPSPGQPVPAGTGDGNGCRVRGCGRSSAMTDSIAHGVAAASEAEAVVVSS